MSNFPTGISYFHGTWNMAHNFWDHKYRWVTNGTRHVLREILTHGIRAFPDPLNPDYSPTVSVTSDPKYALLYALLYSEKGTANLYWVNRLWEWARVLYKILREAKPFSIKKYRMKWKRIVGNREFKRWANSFNNVDYQKWALSWFCAMIWWESNIEWNFPIILWLKDLNSNIQEMPWWNEIRVSWWIPPEHIGAIFAPRDKIKTLPTTNIPIFPLEDFIQKYS